MTKQEIQELMRARGIEHCKDIFPCESADKTQCNSFGVCQNCSDATVYRAGHAAASAVLAECLSVALEALWFYETGADKALDKNTTLATVWKDFVGGKFAHRAKRKIEAKLKGGPEATTERGT